MNLDWKGNLKKEGNFDIIDFSTGNTHKERVFGSAVEAIFHPYIKEKRDERDFET